MDTATSEVMNGTVQIILNGTTILYTKTSIHPDENLTAKKTFKINIPKVNIVLIFLCIYV